MLLFFPFRDEEQLLSGCSSLYQNKLQAKPYGYLVDQAFSHFNESSINNQDPHSPNENNETPAAEYANGNSSKDTETNKTFAILNLILHILTNYEIEKGINSLNSKEREVSNVVHTWAKDYLKYDGHDLELVHIFFSGSGG